MHTGVHVYLKMVLNIMCGCLSIVKYVEPLLQYICHGCRLLPEAAPCINVFVVGLSALQILLDYPTAKCFIRY